jgi:hypothetical protein
LIEALSALAFRSIVFTDVLNFAAISDGVAPLVAIVRARSSLGFLEGLLTCHRVWIEAAPRIIIPVEILRQATVLANLVASALRNEFVPDQSDTGHDP